MTPEKLLTALNDIDSASIREAHAERPAARRGSSRRLIAVLAAVIALVAMTVTAFASEEFRGWFREYFARETSESLTPEQIEYIDENEQTIAETQIQEDYTLEVKTAMTDGCVAYIVIGVTGPEDAILSKTVIEGYSPDAPSLTPGNWGIPARLLKRVGGNGTIASMTCSSEEDYDGLDNTQDMVFIVRDAQTPGGEKPFGPGTVWNLHIENLVAGYINEAYHQELMNGKYAGQENILASDEEGEKLFPEVTLAEGVWDFEITFEDSDIREFELVSEPVTVQACTGWKADGTDVFEDVPITSFVLRSLSASIQFDLEYVAADFSDNNSRRIYVVMKDGSRVQLVSTHGTTGEACFLAESPIILDNVDHILMADGTKLMVP